MDRTDADVPIDGLSVDIPLSEEIVSSVGPFWGLTSLLIYTLTISFPIILVTTELSSALPNDGGYSIWVTEAFGEFWGVQESYWSLVSGIIDNAIYPVLIVDVAEKVIPELRVATWNQKYMIKLALCIAFCLPNLVSVKSVGKMLQFMSVIVILPFAVMVILGTRHMNIIRLTETRPTLFPRISPDRGNHVNMSTPPLLTAVW